MTGFRVGEASHPGPCSADAFSMDSDFSDGFLFQLGTANVAGLSNKVSTVGSLDSGIWGLTETHLTMDGMKAIRPALRKTGLSLRVVNFVRCSEGLLLLGLWVPTRVLGLEWV